MIGYGRGSARRRRLEPLLALRHPVDIGRLPLFSPGAPPANRAAIAALSARVGLRGSQASSRQSPGRSSAISLPERTISGSHRRRPHRDQRRLDDGTRGKHGDLPAAGHGLLHRQAGPDRQDNRRTCLRASAIWLRGCGKGRRRALPRLRGIVPPSRQLRKEPSALAAPADLAPLHRPWPGGCRAGRAAVVAGRAGRRRGELQGLRRARLFLVWHGACRWASLGVLQSHGFRHPPFRAGYRRRLRTGGERALVGAQHSVIGMPCFSPPSGRRCCFVKGSDDGQRNFHRPRCGLGSAKTGSHHWLVQRFTAIGNLILVLWLAVSLLLCPVPISPRCANGSLRGALLLISTFWHARLGMQVLIEDYVHEPAEAARLHRSAEPCRLSGGIRPFLRCPPCVGSALRCLLPLPLGQPTRSSTTPMTRVSVRAGPGLRATMGAPRPVSRPLASPRCFPPAAHTVAAQGGIAATCEQRARSLALAHIRYGQGGRDWLGDQDAIEYLVREAPRGGVRAEH